MEKSILSLTLIQTDLYWENPMANLSMLEEKIWQIDGSTDVIVLPEMFNTGFTMNVEKCAEPMNLTTFKWMKQIAKQSQAALVGSFIVKESGFYVNRLLWVEPSGTFYYYDKRYLFSMAKENLFFKSGNERLIVSWRGWKICPLICYDIRFPEWSRNHFSDGKLSYDCLVYVASFPQARIQAWDILLPARAIENWSYAVGVNRVGTDGNQVAYNGHSAIYDFKGNRLAFLEEKPTIQTFSIAKDVLEEYRQKFPAYLDMR